MNIIDRQSVEDVLKNPSSPIEALMSEYVHSMRKEHEKALFAVDRCCEDYSHDVDLLGGEVNDLTEKVVKLEKEIFNLKEKYEKDS